MDTGPVTSLLVPLLHPAGHGGNVQHAEVLMCQPWQRKNAVFIHMQIYNKLYIYNINRIYYIYYVYVYITWKVFCWWRELAKLPFRWNHLKSSSFRSTLSKSIKCPYPEVGDLHLHLPSPMHFGFPVRDVDSTPPGSLANGSVITVPT